MRLGCLAPALACIAIALSGCGGDHWSVVHDDAAHRTVVVFGDSLAAGVGASTPANGFAALMFASLTNGDPQSSFVDLAVSGSTVGDVIDTQLPEADGRGVEPTDVWLCVGGNDVFHGTPTDAFSTSEHSLVAQLRGRWPAAHVIVFGIPDVTRAQLVPGLSQFHDMAAADNAAAKDAARVSQADFVDLFAFTDSQGDVAADISSDALHPNDAGHAAIAAFAQSKLR